VEGSCEHGNEPFGCLTFCEVLEGLHNWRPLENGSTPWSQHEWSARSNADSKFASFRLASNAKTATDNDLEGNSHGLVEILSRKCNGESGETHANLRQVGVPGFELSAPCIQV
jgi:hypothetical protein